MSHRFFSLSMVLSVLFVGVSCGDSQSSEPVAEFAQNVNEVPYAIQKIVIQSTVKYADGEDFVFETTLSHPDDLVDETIRRVTVNEQYALLVNGERANINIGSSSEFDSTTQRKQEDGCQLDGQSRVQGQARYDRLVVDYTLQNRLKGELCPQSIVDDYEDFHESQLLGLRLNVVRQLLESGFWGLEGSEVVTIKIRIEGVATLAEPAPAE